MGHTILCVDDDRSVLDLLCLQLQRAGHHPLLAANGQEGLAVLQSTAVSMIISDYRMPGMSGTDLLARCRTVQPEAVRIILTGHADVEAAMEAINQGEVYRFLSKPWNKDTLLASVQQALSDLDMRREFAVLRERLREKNEELEAMNAALERRVIERTNELQMAFDFSNALNEDLRAQNRAVVEAFAGLIDLRNPLLGSHCRRTAGFAESLCRKLGLSEQTRVHDTVMAALLHDLGKLALPDEILLKDASQLGPRERAEVEKHPILGESQLQVLNGMAATARLIRQHHENVDGSGYPDGLLQEQIPLEARILRVADVYEERTRGGARRGVEEHLVLQAMDQQIGKSFDPAVFQALLGVLADRTQAHGSVAQTPVALDELADGMILAKDLRTHSGVLLAREGERLGALHLQKIHNLLSVFPAPSHALILAEA
jgi:response regulator RpfG family c-di-GMP phosphodiesterase